MARIPAIKKYQKYVLHAKRLGFDNALIIDTRSVVTNRWVRMKCQYGCDVYGQRLTCPPYSPTPGETEKMLKGYRRGLLIQLANIVPQRETQKSRILKKAVADLEREIFLDGYYRAFGMGSGPCRLCRVCDLTKPCRFPHRARPSMEACGIDVFRTVRNNGLKIDVVRDEKSPCTFFGLILIE